MMSVDVYMQSTSENQHRATRLRQMSEIMRCAEIRRSCGCFCWQSLCRADVSAASTSV